MKVSYRGVSKELPLKQQQKLDAKFGKLSKLLEKRGEKEAHVVVTGERHLQHAEITLQFYDHKLVGVGSDGDAFTAIYTALEKLEKQAVSQRGKWREKTRRTNGSGAPVSLRAATERDADRGAKAPVKKTATPTNGAAKRSGRLNRVNPANSNKPMTLDEAMMHLENGAEYVAYRDADREGMSVLVRRKDGNFDLIES